jgi:hypothetical protein
MSNKTPTPVLVDTDLLSKMVSEILTLVGAPATKKSACLNKVAAMIAGTKHNWGYLTGHEGLVQAKGLAPQLLQRESLTWEQEIVRASILSVMQGMGVPLGIVNLRMADHISARYLQSRDETSAPINTVADVIGDLRDNHQSMLSAMKQALLPMDVKASQLHSEDLFIWPDGDMATLGEINSGAYDWKSDDYRPATEEEAREAGYL